ncbi:unnamed protein product [Nippostrongylus brasiliensis]|uniref:RNA helicase n=1 Tax=Nippostrongylus brasiliensis TaxID=27835 RepID=A0A0N4YV35_NIPBR|nr:unnamed protein product [Nippostrongylus brasiliensis]
MTEESGMEAIHELMANMGATALASVKRHADILAQYVPKPDDFTIKVDRPELKEPSFLKCLIKIMESIQNEVQPQLKRLTEKNETEHVLPKEDVKFEDPLATEKYIQKINTLATTLSRIRNGDFKFEPSIALEYLSVLSQGISINDLMPAKYSLMYLERNLAALKEKFQLKSEASDAKPIVMALEKELRTQFKQDSNSRAIIFVTRRSTAVELMHYLNTDQVLGCKDLVIVATSVVEEGLDVSTCNLIIKYNSSSNAVQRAIMAEKIADKCLKRIEDRGEKALEKKVLEVMDRQAKERKVHEEHRKRAQEALKDKLFSIRCKIDSTDVCTSSDVRTINGSSYVCVDPTIWGRMEIRTKDVSSKMKFVDEVTQILAEVHCKCGQTIGNVMKYAGTYLPMLNISNLMFSEKIEGQDAPAEAITQWSKAGGRFWIPEATEHELLNTENKEDKTKLDAMCEKIVAQQEKMLERERRKKEETRRTKTEWNAD